MVAIYELIKRVQAESRDLKAKQFGFIVVLTGELYTRTLGRNSSVYIERIGSQWEAWRETYRFERKEPIHCKTIATAEGFEYVLLKAKNYFGYIERKRSSKK